MAQQQRPDDEQPPPDKQHEPQATASSSSSQKQQQDDERLGRFGIAVTPRVRQLLQRAAALDGAPPDLRERCGRLAEAAAAAADGEKDGGGSAATAVVVPWKLLTAALELLRRGAPPGDAAHAPLPALLEGAALVLRSPPPRVRSAALQARLKLLQEQEDARRYAAMVADVDGAARLGGGGTDGADGDNFFPTTKLQLSFGLHVLATMGALAALGFYAGRLLLRSEAAAALCAALGLTAGLLLEAALFIVRHNLPAPLEKRYGHLMGGEWERRQQQQQQQPEPAAAAGVGRLKEE